MTDSFDDQGPPWEEEIAPPPTDEDVPPDVAVSGLSARSGKKKTKGKKAKGKKSHATMVVELVEEMGVELFRSPDQKTYARAPINGHFETRRLNDGSFHHWLALKFLERHKRVPAKQAITSAVSVLDAKALFEGQEHEVFVRVAGDSTAAYLDLGDDSWGVVKITPGGWEVIFDPPVRFRRPPGMLALPVPLRGGSLRDLRPFINVTEADWPLICGFLVGALNPAGPYPILDLHGEQGSSKSTCCEFLRALIDPNSAGLRAEPRNAQDLMISANNAWVLTYENVSYIHPWFSDALCRMSTGGAFSTRELYSDDSEILFEAQRPIMLNGINELSTRSDLLDRSILVSLPAIKESERKLKKDLWNDFLSVRPKILGALCGAACVALAREGTVELGQMPSLPT